MSTLACPRCGHDIPTLDLELTIVTVCDRCWSVIERKDVGLTVKGVLGPLRDTGSRLRVGLRGRHGQRFFTVSGRTQSQHATGNVWDEWYVVFDDNRWGWLAEDQGRYMLTYPEADVRPPSYDQLRVGQELNLGDRRFTVAELDQAQIVAAEGEMPFVFEPNEVFRYADLSGEGGGFGTLDFGHDPPRAYLGRELDAAAFFLGHAEDPDPIAPSGAAVTAFTCPGCARSEPLRVPSETVRVICPACRVVADLEAGGWRRASGEAATPEGARARPLVALGTAGLLRGERLTCVGWVFRSTRVEGKRYDWHEHLLHGPAGFRWLTCNQGHWTLGWAVGAGEVRPAGRNLRHAGSTFERFTEGRVTTDGMLGELYWRAEAGETVEAADYVAPPAMLSVERTDRERHVAVAVHVEGAAVEAAFGLRSTPAPVGVGPAEPFRHERIFQAFRWLAAAAIGVGLVTCAGASRRAVVTVGGLVSGEAGAARPVVVVSDPFELKGDGRLEISAAANVDNSWVFVAGDLVNEATGALHGFEIEVEYWHGRDSDGDWSEGSTGASTHIGRVEPGTYRLRYEVSRPPQDLREPTVQISVAEDVGDPGGLTLTLLVLGLPAGLVMFGRFQHQRRRWENADFPRESPFTGLKWGDDA